MISVEGYIEELETPQREIAQAIHQILTEDFGLTSKIRFKIPFYFNHSWICYINPSKYGKLDLSFTRGNELSNQYRLLDHKGRKQISSLEIKSVKQCHNQKLWETLQEAILLDEAVPYASKNKKKK